MKIQRLMQVIAVTGSVAAAVPALATGPLDAQRATPQCGDEDKDDDGEDGEDDGEETRLCGDEDDGDDGEDGDEGEDSGDTSVAIEL